MYLWIMIIRLSKNSYMHKVALIQSLLFAISLLKPKCSKNYSTQYSRVVPHHSTDWAITSLTSEIRRDPVCSGVYGRNWKECL